MKYSHDEWGPPAGCIQAQPQGESNSDPIDGASDARAKAEFLPRFVGGKLYRVQVHQRFAAQVYQASHVAGGRSCDQGESCESDREITTTARGKRYAASLEGTLTGLGGNLIIIDDPIKLGDAFSEVVRKRSIDWYKGTLVTRPDDKKAARIVVVVQRVHQEDLVGYLQENEEYEVLNLPAIAPTRGHFQTGPNSTYRRHQGDILHPDRESAEVLLGLKKSMGLMSFFAQYQQAPVPSGGTYIKSKDLKSYSQISPQPGDRMVLSWDIAMREMENNDHSAGVVCTENLNPEIVVMKSSEDRV
jgi:hypothetical protein